MTHGNFKLALHTIRSNKWRSFLTTLGIVIGVSSVVMIVSLGEGVKQQVVGQINCLGSTLITLKPGKIVTRDASGKITGVNYSTILGGNTFSDADFSAIT